MILFSRKPAILHIMVISLMSFLFKEQLHTSVRLITILRKLQYGKHLILLQDVKAQVICFQVIIFKSQDLHLNSIFL